MCRVALAGTRRVHFFPHSALAATILFFREAMSLLPVFFDSAWSGANFHDA
jgi:hypothetical protein